MSLTRPPEARERKGWDLIVTSRSGVMWLRPIICSTSPLFSSVGQTFLLQGLKGSISSLRASNRPFTYFQPFSSCHLLQCWRSSAPGFLWYKSGFLFLHELAIYGLLSLLLLIHLLFSLENSVASFPSFHIYMIIHIKVKSIS